MREQLITQIVAKLVEYGNPDDSPAIATLANHIAGSDAYTLVGGALKPSNRDAIKQLREQGVPMAFIEGVARESAEKIPNPAMRVLALYEGMGTTFEAEIMGEENRASRGVM
jgi:hypothetical protein